jgi:hypothetical protein
MKNLNYKTVMVKAALLSALTGMCASAYAATSSITVSATVPFTVAAHMGYGTGNSVAFGNLSLVNNNFDDTYFCAVANGSNGVTVSFSGLNNVGTKFNMVSGTNRLPYSVTYGPQLISI